MIAELSPTARRPLLAAIVVTVSALAGLLCASVFGRGFAPAAPVEVSGSGFIQIVRLPMGARTMNELTSFEVDIGGADDFARVYVNNYLVVSTENPKAILMFWPELDATAATNVAPGSEAEYAGTRSQRGDRSDPQGNQHDCI